MNLSFLTTGLMHPADGHRHPTGYYKLWSFSQPKDFRAQLSYSLFLVPKPKEGETFHSHTKPAATDFYELVSRIEFGRSVISRGGLSDTLIPGWKMSNKELWRKNSWWW